MVRSAKRPFVFEPLIDVEVDEAAVTRRPITRPKWFHPVLSFSSFARIDRLIDGRIDAAVVGEQLRHTTRRRNRECLAFARGVLFHQAAPWGEPNHDGGR
jgi:hypothetical protein